MFHTKPQFSAPRIQARLHSSRIYEVSQLRSYFHGLASLTVLCGPLFAQMPFQITTASPLPSGAAGTPYSQQLTATAGFQMPYTWSVSSGTLPAGLTLSSSG